MSDYFVVFRALWQAGNSDNFVTLRAIQAGNSDDFVTFRAIQEEIRMTPLLPKTV